MQQQRKSKEDEPSLSFLSPEIILAMAQHSFRSLLETRPDLSGDLLFQLGLFQLNTALAKLKEEAIG